MADPVVAAPASPIPAPAATPATAPAPTPAVAAPAPVASPVAPSAPAAFSPAPAEIPVTPAPAEAPAVAAIAAPAEAPAKDASILGAAAEPMAKAEDAKPETPAEPTPPAPLVYEPFKFPDGVTAPEGIGAYTDIFAKHQVPQDAVQELINFHLGQVPARMRRAGDGASHGATCRVGNHAQRLARCFHRRSRHWRQSQRHDDFSSGWRDRAVRRHGRAAKRIALDL